MIPERFIQSTGNRGINVAVYINTEAQRPDTPISSMSRKGYQSRPHKVAAIRQLITGRKVCGFLVGISRWPILAVSLKK
jgi:hypothetical protein